MQNKPRISGAIFENTSGRGPRFTGVIEIDGKKEQIAFWEKTSERSGKNYLQISEDRKKPQGNQPQKPQGWQPPRPSGVQGGPAKLSGFGKNTDMDDDIPF